MRNWIIGLVVVALLMATGMFWGIHNMKVDWLQAIMLIFTYYGMFVIFVAAVFKTKKPKGDPSYLPYVSLLVAARNEEAVIAKTIRSLMKIDYLKDNQPNFEVIVFDDNSVDRTFSRASALLKEYPNLKVIHRSPEVGGKGKSDVLNQGLREAKGEVIGVFDADTEVAPDFIQKCIPYLSDKKVGGVQGRVRLYNRSKNILTGLQEDEFAVVSHLYQLGKELLGGLTALGGNGQLVKTEALESVNGWNYLSPTEDLDLTFRLLFKGWDVRYSPEAVLWQEGVETVHAFIRQRIRWAEGFLKCIFDYTAPLTIGKYTIMKKIDGLMTMGRVLVPFFVWIGYAFVFISLIKGIEFNSGISQSLIAASSWCFFAAMLIGMVRVMYPNPFIAIWRVLQYFIYGSVWIIAVPLGYINCFLHLNDIHWDKTVHTGSSDEEEIAGVGAAAISAKYRETGAVS